MGALAISTLAGCRMLATIGTLGWASALHDAARWLAIAAWIGALLWLPALIAAESWRLRHPPLYTPARWSTVFPLGMLAVASHALASGAGVSPATIVFHVFAVLAVAAWIATAAGFAMSWRARTPRASARGLPRVRGRTAPSARRTPEARAAQAAAGEQLVGPAGVEADRVVEVADGSWGAPPYSSRIGLMRSAFSIRPRRHAMPGSCAGYSRLSRPATRRAHRIRVDEVQGLPHRRGRPRTTMASTMKSTGTS